LRTAWAGETRWVVEALGWRDSPQGRVGSREECVGRGNCSGYLEA